MYMMHSGLIFILLILFDPSSVEVPLHFHALLFLVLILSLSRVGSCEHGGGIIHWSMGNSPAAASPFFNL